MSNFDYTTARTGQSRAIETGMNRISQGEITTSTVLPAGYGKTDVIVMSALELWVSGVIACALVIEPGILLREQVVNDDKMKARLRRYQVRYSPVRAKSIKTVGVRYNADGEFLLTATIQLVQNNVENFAQWIRSVIYHTGKKVVVYVDEVHTHTNMNDWGRTIEVLKNAGAHIWVLTATPYRDDGSRIIGFASKEVGNEPVTITRIHEGSVPENVLVQIWEGTRTRYELLADYAHTFAEAWEERAICRINRRGFDIEVKTVAPELNGKSNTKMLSDLSESDVRKALGKVVRNHEFIRKGVVEMVARLRQVRRVDDTCAAIVFTANDEDGSVNSHAKTIEKIIKEVDPALKCTIATSADDEQDDLGVNAINKFADGYGQVLIVKQMASLGLDIERLKVVLDLSPVRAVNAFIQRVCRASRIYGAIHVAHLIAPDDVLSIANWETYIVGAGGEAKSSELDLIEEYEVPKNDERQPSLFSFANPRLNDFDDTDQKHATREDLGVILALIDEIPEIVAHYTFPDIVAKATRLGIFAAPIADVYTNTGDVLHDVRTEVNQKHKSLVKLRLARNGKAYKGSTSDKNEWGRMAMTTWMEAYRAAHTNNIDDIENIDEMRRLRDALDTMIDRELVA